MYFNSSLNHLTSFTKRLQNINVLSQTRTQTNSASMKMKSWDDDEVFYLISSPIIPDRKLDSI